MILWTRTAARVAALTAASLIWIFCADDAHAQPVLPSRPRAEIAIGMGISVDNPGLSDGRTVAVPSFQVQAGVGGGPLGFEVRLFSSAADGRYHQANGASEAAVNRLGVDVMLAWRPLGQTNPGNVRLLARLLRSVTVDVGLGVENASSSQKSGMRRGVVLGVHLDFPLTPITDASELRVRVVARRLVAGHAEVGSTTVSDSRGEAIAALVFIF